MELLINYLELDIFLFRIKNNGRQWDIVTFYELKKDSWECWIEVINFEVIK